MDNPQAAQRMAEKIQEAVEYLIEYPTMGRTGRVRSTRELVVTGTPFIVVYSIKIPAVQIFRMKEIWGSWKLEFNLLPVINFHSDMTLAVSCFVNNLLNMEGKCKELILILVQLV